MKPAALLAASTLALAAAMTVGYSIGTRSPGGNGASDPSAAAKAPATAAQRKPLYYRNPMGLPDTSPVPKKDPMGMDYVPVYEDDEPQASAPQVRIGIDKVQKLGVRTEAAAVRDLARVVRAVGRVEADERRLYAVAPKFEGWIQRLHVNATGQKVARGEPLLEVYSPELVSAQREYAIAAEGVEALKRAEGQAQRGIRQLADSSMARLRNWDISEAELRGLRDSGEARHTLVLRSPVTGTVMERKAVQGMRFMPGEMLYQIADLSHVWILADVFEQDLGAVAVGGRAKATIAAYPGKELPARVSYVYPTLNAMTRTTQVRLELPNPGGLLKPGMFAHVELDVGGRDGKGLAVPTSAVIDSGVRRIVLVALAEGRFEPREVKLGRQGEDHVEVLEGVAEGENVVVTANFLIDAESNLKAAVAGFGGQHQGH